MSHVQLKQIYKSFGATKVVRGIDLDIRPDEFIVLVGPSGCGKSTILRMLAGLEEVSEGDIFLNDKEATFLPAKDRDVAMVFQDYALYPHMSVYENMAFGLRIKKLSDEEIESRIQSAAQILGLTDYLKRKPSALSGGQRQRVAMGRAIVKQASIFLYDEPLSNLDAKLRSQMRQEIKRFHTKYSSTVVYVTHDQTEAMTLADRLVILNEGHIEQMGTPMEVFENPRTHFVADFLSQPHMNFFDVKVSGDNAQNLTVTQDGINGFHFLLPENKAKSFLKNKNLMDQVFTMGIRASDIYPVEKNDSAAWQTKGQFLFSEPMGKNAYLSFQVGSQECVGEVSGQKLPEKNSECTLEFNLNFSHFFDKRTGLNIEWS